MQRLRLPVTSSSAAGVPVPDRIAVNVDEYLARRLEEFAAFKSSAAGDLIISCGYSDRAYCEFNSHAHADHLFSSVSMVFRPDEGVLFRVEEPYNGDWIAEWAETPIIPLAALRQLMADAGFDQLSGRLDPSGSIKAADLKAFTERCRLSGLDITTHAPSVVEVYGSALQGAHAPDEGGILPSMG